MMRLTSRRQSGLLCRTYGAPHLCSTHTQGLRTWAKLFRLPTEAAAFEIAKDFFILCEDCFFCEASFSSRGCAFLAEVLFISRRLQIMASAQSAQDNYWAAFRRRPQSTSREEPTMDIPTVNKAAVISPSCQGRALWPAEVIGERAAVPKIAARMTAAQFT